MIQEMNRGKLVKKFNELSKQKGIDIDTCTCQERVKVLA